MTDSIDVWVSYPLKQGLKPHCLNSRVWATPVWVSYPLKQGLKQIPTNSHYPNITCLSQLSIKTRIETGCKSNGDVSFTACLSQLSIKTRIETHLQHRDYKPYPNVWVSYPLKQGLKLVICITAPGPELGLSQLSIKTRIETGKKPGAEIICASCLSQLSIKTRIETGMPLRLGRYDPVWVSYPLKQGLKQILRPLIDEWEQVWVSYPLKQGLKHQPFSNSLFNGSVWVSYPLKQGLKHGSLTFVWQIASTSLSQLSIKTRIETQIINPQACPINCLSQLSIKTRIETSWIL